MLLVGIWNNKMIWKGLQTAMPSNVKSPLTNRRKDEFGGSLENRARFPWMILKRIRKAVGNDFILEILMSGEEDSVGATPERTAPGI